MLCRESKPLAEFNKRQASKDGLQSVCRDCNKARSRQYYTDNKEKHLAVVRVKQITRLQGLQQKLGEYLLEHPCVDCGNSDVRVLDFDHLGDKFMDVTMMVKDGFSWPKILIEIAKCEVRCRNCHAIKTYERTPCWRNNFV